MKNPITQQLAYMAQMQSPQVGLLEWDRARYPAAYLLRRVTEAQVQKAILAELHRLGIFAFAIDSGAKMMRGRAFGVMRKAGVFASDAASALAGRTGAGRAGMADIYGTLPGGRALWIECKAPEWRHTETSTRNTGISETRSFQDRPAGKPSPAQIAFLSEQLALGAAAGIAWHPLDLLMILPTEYLRRINHDHAPPA